MLGKDRFQNSFDIKLKYQEIFSKQQLILKLIMENTQKCLLRLLTLIIMVQFMLILTIEVLNSVYNQYTKTTLVAYPITFVIVYTIWIIIQRRYEQYSQASSLFCGIVILIILRSIDNKGQSYLISSSIVYSLLNYKTIHLHKEAFIFITIQVVVMYFDSFYDNEDLVIQIIIVISVLHQIIFIFIVVVLHKKQPIVEQSVKFDSSRLRTKEIEFIIEKLQSILLIIFYLSSWLNNHNAFIFDLDGLLQYCFQNQSDIATPNMIESLDQLFIYKDNLMKSDQIIKEISQDNDQIYPNLLQFVSQNESTFINIIVIQDHNQVFYIVHQQDIPKIDSKLASLLDVTSSISHELSSHLNCIITLSQLYCDNSDLLKQQQQETFIEPILSNSQQLELIINNLKDYGNIQSNCFMSQIQKFDIVFEIFEICDYFKMIIQEKQLQINYKFLLDNHFIESDRQRFRQIFYQIIQNAVKFTFRKNIQIKACNEQDLIKIQVIDQGQGMDESEQHQLLEVLRIGKPARVSKKSVGCSLGLLISNILAKKIGDNRHIQFESAIKKGSTFTFWIKNFEYQQTNKKNNSTLNRISLEQYHDSQLENLIQAQSMVNEYHSHSRLSVQFKNMINQKNRSHEENISLNYSDDFMQAKWPPQLHANVFKQTYNLGIKFNRIGNCCIQILIVDDEFFNIFALQAFLKQQNHKSEYAFDGQEAMDKIQTKLDNPCQQCNSNSYKLVFLDINMPVKDGIQTVREIKEIVSTKHLQNICCAANSAFSDIETKQKAYEAGMDFYLTKPLNLPILKQLINNIFVVKSS